MIDVVRLEETGGPEVLKLDRVEPQQPGPGEVWLEQRAIGVNYLDVTQRNGAVPIPLPSGLGLEGAGYVRAVGAGVTSVAIGDRVAYALGPLGSYASERSYPAERLIRISDGISFTDAAATLFKGLTAQYLIKSTYPVAPGTVVLLYGAAGAVGQIMAAWATHLGATVFLTRPGLAAHITDLQEYRERARDVFDALSSNAFTPNIWREAPLADVVEIHRSLDAGANEGAIVLTP